MLKRASLSREARWLLALLALALPFAPATAQNAPSPSASTAQEKSAEADLKARPDVAKFAARVEAALAESGPSKGHWAVLVVDAATGDTLYARNPLRYYAPASTTKLFTTALALAALGPDYRFRTTVETRGALEASGCLRGDLVLVGRGDPNLSNRKFPFAKEVERDGPPEKVLSELADAVAARGVREIEGDIVAEDSYFDYERFPSGWTIDDAVWSYGAAVSALAVNDNTITLELRPGERAGDATAYSLEPWAGYYKIQNEVTTALAGSERKLKLTREPGARVFVVSGTLPLKSASPRLTFAVEEPAEHAAYLFKRLLEARGICVYGQPRAQHTPDVATAPATVLAERLSVPLADAIRPLNKMSVNLHAELLLRTAAREKAGAVNYEDALKFAQEFFKTAGVPEADVLLWDGSGLSRRNLITPVAVVALLRYAAQQPWGELYRSTLPVAGEDGTLAERMKNTSAAGRILAKTGTLEHAVALGGYATTLHGARLVFSIFGNNFHLNGRAAPAVVDTICVAMVEELGASPRTYAVPIPGEWNP